MILASLIPVQYRMAAAGGVALVLLAGSAAAGWTINGWRLGEEIKAIEAKHAKAVADAEQIANAKLLEQQQARQELENRLALQDQQHYGELQNAKADNDRLSADLDAARQRMRVPIKAGSCRHVSASASAPAASSVDDGAYTADIQPESAAALTRLAGDADACAVKLAALQNWAQDIQEWLHKITQAN